MEKKTEKTENYLVNSEVPFSKGMKSRIVHVFLDDGSFRTENSTEPTKQTMKITNKAFGKMNSNFIIKYYIK